MIDLVVSGGLVVVPGRTAPLDVGVAGERIAYVAELRVEQEVRSVVYWTKLELDRGTMRAALATVLPA